MKRVWHRVEQGIDRIIPYMLVLLLGMLIVLFFFHDLAIQYHTLIEWLDRIIIVVFTADLIFKFIRVRKIKKFIRLYWLDILAVFPFYLFLRAIEEIYVLFRISDTVKESQAVLHGSLGLKEAGLFEKEAARIVQETEKVGKFSRSRFATRFFRPIARTPRLMKFLPYYEKTTGKHHAHDPKKKLNTRKKVKRWFK